jgi:Ca2+-binding EF-hand superfamily protein
METKMFKPLICTALVLASGFALAQDAGGDREARRAEWQAKAEARFAEADKDRDGRLDKVEVQAYGDRMVRNFDRIDANKDGELERSEIAQARRHAAGQQGRQRMKMMQAYQRGLFKGMDDDGNGAISRAELGDKMPRWAENFAAIDADGNGEMSAEELKAHRQKMRAEHRAKREG